MRWGGGTWAVGRGRSRRVGRGGDLGGAHERAAHDDSFAARRDVRELLFDVALVDGAVALEGTGTSHSSSVAEAHTTLLVAAFYA